MFLKVQELIDESQKTPGILGGNLNIFVVGLFLGLVFQRVQDHIIVALTEAEAAKWTSYEALWRVDSGRDDAALGVSMAKAVASDGFSKACDASHNVHAGVGVDLDFGLTHYTVRARTFQHYLGDATFHRKRMASLMALS